MKLSYRLTRYPLGEDLLLESFFSQPRVGATSSTAPQTEKLVPQPQEDVAFGLLTLKWAPLSSLA